MTAISASSPACSRSTSTSSSSRPWALWEVETSTSGRRRDASKSAPRTRRPPEPLPSHQVPLRGPSFAPGPADRPAATGARLFEAGSHRFSASVHGIRPVLGCKCPAHGALRPSDAATRTTAHAESELRSPSARSRWKRSASEPPLPPPSPCAAQGWRIKPISWSELQTTATALHAVPPRPRARSPYTRNPAVTGATYVADHCHERVPVRLPSPVLERPSRL